MENAGSERHVSSAYLHMTFMELPWKVSLWTGEYIYKSIALFNYSNQPEQEAAKCASANNTLYDRLYSKQGTRGTLSPRRLWPAIWQTNVVALLLTFSDKMIWQWWPSLRTFYFRSAIICGNLQLSPHQQTALKQNNSINDLLSKITVLMISVLKICTWLFTETFYKCDNIELIPKMSQVQAI